MLTREQKAWLVTGYCNTDKGCSDGCALYDICKNNHDDFIFCEEAELDACLKIIAPNVLEEPKPVAAQSQWISVLDKLPETFKPVIVCREYEKGTPKVEQGYRDVNGWWKVFGCRVKSVTYWMPLPEPPEVERNE